jgi:ABC-type sugar transport system substrate-binding protein
MVIFLAEGKKEETISRRKYLQVSGGLAAAAIAGWGVAGYLGTVAPPGPQQVVTEKTVTETATATVTGQKKRIKVGFITQISAPYWIIVQRGFEKAGKRWGFDTEVYHPTSPVDISLQSRTFEEWTAAGLDAIIIGPNDPHALDNDINHAADLGIPVLTEDVDAPDSKRVLMVGYDPYGIGVYGGHQMLANLQNRGMWAPGKPGKVVWACGDTVTTEAVQAPKGFREVLNAAGIDVVEHLIDNGDTGLAGSMAREALAKHPDLTGVWAYYDYEGPVWGEVMIDTKRTDVLLQTHALFPEIMPYLEKGVVKGVVDNKQFERGIVVGEIAYDLASSPKEQWETICKTYVRDYPANKMFYYSQGYVTPENYKEYLQNYPELAAELGVTLS